jgi:ABC-type phosphate transport system substrate-binding protein
VRPKRLLNRQFARRAAVLRKTNGIVAAGIVTAALTSGIVASASADPRYTPPGPALVGVGNDATETLFDNLSRIYNDEKPPGHGMYSWWATGSSPIVPKEGCQPIDRPNGSSPGVHALDTRQVLPNGVPCIDFARSLSPRTPNAPATDVWVPFALDAIGWAANAGSNAPASLAAADLKAIIECTATRWDQVGGTSDDTIQVSLPAQGPGILTLLHHMAGVDQIGSCVGYQQQDQGTSPAIAGNPDALVFYSVGKYIAQADDGIADVHGDLVLGKVDGLSPVVRNPVTGRMQVNAGQVPGTAPYSQAFLLPEWVVLAKSPDGTVSPQLSQLFLGGGSWICSDPRAQRAIQNYGFLPLPPGQCGQPS